MPRDEILKPLQDGPEMRAHAPGGALRPSRSDRFEDRSVLKVSFLHPPGRGEQRSTHPIEVHAQGIKRFADALQTKSVGHLTMEPCVELVKAPEVATVKGRPLIAEVLAHLIHSAHRQLGGAQCRNFDFEQTAHHHPLLDVRQPESC